MPFTDATAITLDIRWCALFGTKLLSRATYRFILQKSRCKVICLASSCVLQSLQRVLSALLRVKDGVCVLVCVFSAITLSPSFQRTTEPDGLNGEKGRDLLVLNQISIDEVRSMIAFLDKATR